MFKAIREFWSGGRTRRLAGLFAFEFLVVVAGVLAAQLVAGWADEQAALREIEIANSRIEKELSQNLGKALIWTASLPCLRNRMESIMRLGPGETIEPYSSLRPRFEPFLSIDLNDQQAGYFRVRYGDERADRLREMQQNLENAQANINPIIHLWGRIILVDPARGSVAPSDRDQARMAAADILAELRGMEIVMREFSGRARTWGIKPAFARIGLPAKRCGEIWASQAIAIPPAN
jgi:hypothetical protein